jgi:hypothetical protein
MAMVVRHERAFDERDELPAQEHNRYTEGANVVSLEQSL